MGISCSGCRDEGRYPNRPLTLVCPWSKGGGTDTVSRQIAALLETELEIPVNVINATGGSGVTGHTRGALAKPDGYTIGVFNLPGVLIPQLQGIPVNYDLFEMTWLSTLSKDAYAFVVKGDSSIASINAVRPASRDSAGSHTW